MCSELSFASGPALLLSQDAVHYLSSYFLERGELHNTHRLKLGAPFIDVQTAMCLQSTGIEVVDVPFIHVNLCGLCVNWDYDRSGAVTLEEFSRGLSEKGADVDTSTVTALFAQWDKDLDAQWDKLEMRAWLRSGDVSFTWPHQSLRVAEITILANLNVKEIKEFHEQVHVEQREIVTLSDAALWDDVSNSQWEESREL
jgi:hypothetical protein